jgi:hypothetical protein
VAREFLKLLFLFGSPWHRITGTTHSRTLQSAGGLALGSAFGLVNWAWAHAQCLFNLDSYLSNDMALPQLT